MSGRRVAVALKLQGSSWYVVRSPYCRFLTHKRTPHISTLVTWHVHCLIPFPSPYVAVPDAYTLVYLSIPVLIITDTYRHVILTMVARIRVDNLRMHRVHIDIVGHALSLQTTISRGPTRSCNDYTSVLNSISLASISGIRQQGGC